MTHTGADSWEGSSLYYQYIKDVNRYPLINRAEENELLRRVKEGDQRALHKLVCSNLKFVINVAFLYKNQGFTITELINEGNLGLIEAARRFDTGRNLKFISYAVWWIRQGITRAIAERARLVRISAEKELVLRRFARQNIPMRQAVGGGLTIDASALGKKMGYSPDQVEKIMEMGLRHASLDDPLGEGDGASIMDLMEDENTPSPDLRIEADSRQALLRQQLARIPAQERQVLELYFGVDKTDAMNLEEIGEQIGLSKERVRQIKEKGLASLRAIDEIRELAYAA